MYDGKWYSGSGYTVQYTVQLDSILIVTETMIVTETIWWQYWEYWEDDDPATGAVENVTEEYSSIDCIRKVEVAKWHFGSWHIWT